MAHHCRCANVQADLPTPHKENLETHEKNLEILQKLVRFNFFPIKIKNMELRSS